MIRKHGVTSALGVCRRRGVLSGYRVALFFLVASTIPTFQRVQPGKVKQRVLVARQLRACAHVGGRRMLLRRPQPRERGGLGFLR